MTQAKAELARGPNRGERTCREARKRVLIVNAFIDEYRRTHGSPHRVPRAMGPVYLAGVFAPDRCELRLYNEQYSGPLTDLALLGWPDMLVLTGVTSSFDRMKQLAAYARALNDKVVVVAGGPPVRALPRLSRRFFDYGCTGDLEQLGEVVRDVFGQAYVADEIFPRYDLPYGGGMFGYVESSRNCNFRCSFCSLTGEKGRYQAYDLNVVQRQILACGKKQIIFIDNNFYGNDRDFFSAKVQLCADFVRAGVIDGWSCLVTGDFFARSDNLKFVRRAGCKAIFSGIESFSAEVLRSYNKKQNTLVPQAQTIRNCLEEGVAFAYGIMLDPTARTLRDLRGEIEFIVKSGEITLPAFFTLAIPLVGTPYFRECLSQRMFFANTRLRNLDGVTLTMHPLDPIDDVLSFLRDLPRLRGYRTDVIRHTARFVRRYWRVLDRWQMSAALLSAALICTESFASSPTRLRLKHARQTYFGPTEPLDPIYTPSMRLPERYQDHFLPTMVTDETGAIHSDMA
jgi:hopanoid C-2 methylase